MFEHFIQKGPAVTPLSTEEVKAEGTTKKRGRPKKTEDNNLPAVQPTAEVITLDNNNTNVGKSGLPMCQSSDPYIDTFQETNNMLRYSIGQLDVLTSDVKRELDTVSASKTLKGKYKYISELCSTASTLVSSKISAIKELNAVTHNCHKLELQRLKDVKNSEANKQDDDKYITDLYNAYINIPTGGMSNPALKYTSANVAGNMGALMNGVGINNMGANEEQNFQNYMANLTPEQNRMILGNSGNIETVVVYDPMTGAKAFEVIDTTTGMSVDNYPRPNASFLDDTSVDVSTGIATNSNLGQTWKVVVAAL